MKYRFVIHHLDSGNVWTGVYNDLTAEEVVENELFLQNAVNKATYLQLVLENGSSVFLPEKLIRDCVLVFEPENKR